MSVWTSTLKATPPERQRAISSPSTTLERKSPPAQPPPEGLRDLPRVLPHLDVRGHFLLHEGADAPPQHLVLLGEQAMHHVSSRAGACSCTDCQIVASPSRAAHSVTYPLSIAGPRILSIPRMSRRCRSDPPSLK